MGMCIRLIAQEVNYKTMKEIWFKTATRVKIRNGVLLHAIIVIGLAGCSKYQETQPVKESVPIEAFTVIDAGIGAEEWKQTPYIVVFGNPGHSLKCDLLYLIQQDGAIIWSKDRCGGPPYYVNRISANRMNDLKNELLFLENINSQFRFIPRWRRPPDYGFGVMNIIDKEVYMSIMVVGRVGCLRFYLWPDNNEELEDRELIKLLEKKGDFSIDKQAEYADRLWGYLIRILEKYEPDSGQKIEKIDFKLKPVTYSYTVQK